ncbi:amidohydrolase [Pseudomonas citri]|uniref:amidohydrolase n=1 Tax=Pseudomonas citri TaxID=2978349 RepID=UPI0021B61D21|nr:amidohydrolase family protein [Pseudomonas citri]
MSKTAQRTLIFGGPVLTQNERRETHEAIVLEGDTVVATGGYDEMRSLAGASALQVDVQGACVMPGLIDNHPHSLHFGSFDANCVKLYDARDHDDIRARIRKRAQVTPPGQWIVTTPVGEPHYFIRKSWRDLPEGRLPNRFELDAAAPDHPVWIQAYAPKLPNVCAMNSKALQMLGFTRELPNFIDDVFIEKDENGELTGIFSGYVTNYYNSSLFWLTRVVAQVLRPSEDFWYQGALAGQVTAAQRGVTSAYEGHSMDPEHIAAYQRARDEGQLSMRVLAALESGSVALDYGLGLTDERVRANFALAAKLTQTVDPMFRVNGLTLGVGGPGWSGQMPTDHPYSDPFGRLTKGRSFVSGAIEREAIEFCLRNNVRLNLMPTSGRDHRRFLESLEPFLGEWDVRAREWIMQHNIFIDDATLERYADLQFHLTTSLSFCFGKGDMYRDRMGEQALKELIPVGKMYASGANVGLGTDWGPSSVFEHIALAQTREFAGSGYRHEGPGYSINRQQALDGWTIHNARLMQWDGIGALKPGFKADLVIVDQNPLTCSIDELSETKVLRTVLGGKDIFDAQVIRRMDDAELAPERLQPLETYTASSYGAHKCGPNCNHSA